MHHVKANNTDGYAVLEKYVTEYLKNKGEDVDTLISEIIKNRKSHGEVLDRTGALEELVANALSDITTDAGALEVFLNLNSKERTKLREVLEGIAARIKEFARKLTGVESRILIKDADVLKKFAKELSAQLDTAGKQAQKNTADSGVKYSFVDNISKSKESKFIINTINNNIHKVDNNTIFEVHSEDVSIYKAKSDYVLDVFNGQGNIAYNTTLGIVELSRKGAKSTTFHGFGSVKLAATRAIKNVIEEGKIIYSEENYLEKGYDRHIIAARGLINDTPSIVGVIVQSYPRQKFNSKFYLHEAITIEVASHIMTGTINGTPVSETTSINNISFETDDVKKNSFADEEYPAAVEREDMEAAQALVDEAAERKFRNSKARDMDGKLIKVYHGTESDVFYEFDKNRRGQTDSSLWGRGYYFSSDSEFAEDFGDNVQSFVLNITNPFVVSKVDAPASEIADKLIALGETVDFDYSNLKAYEFANHFGNQKFTDVLTAYGYDGVIIDNFEYVTFDTKKKDSEHNSESI